MINLRFFSSKTLVSYKDYKIPKYLNNSKLTLQDEYDRYLLEIWKSYKRNNHVKVCKIFEEMQSAGIQPCFKTYRLVLRSLFRIDSNKAIQLFNQIKNDENIPTSFWNEMLTCQTLKNKNGVRSFFEKMKEENVVDAKSYRIFVEFLFQEDAIEEAFSLIQEIREKNLLTDEVSIAIMNHFIKNDEPEKAIAWFDEMKSSRTTKPSLELYNCYLHALGLSNQIEKAEQVFESISPNFNTLRILMKIYSIQGNTEKVKKTFKLMKTKYNFIPTIECYHMLLKVFVREGKTEQAVQLIGKLRHLGLTPTYEMYRSLMLGFLSENNVEKAKLVMIVMDVDRIEVTTEMYNLIIRHLVEREEFSRAKEFLNEMVKKGLELDEETEGYIEIINSIKY